MIEIIVNIILSSIGMIICGFCSVYTFLVGYYVFSFINAVLFLINLSIIIAKFHELKDYK